MRTHAHPLTGCSERLPCQPTPDESDARHGAYDFYAEQMEAPGEASALARTGRSLPRLSLYRAFMPCASADDLNQLTDLHESMAFRRRGA